MCDKKERKHSIKYLQLSDYENAEVSKIMFLVFINPVYLFNQLEFLATEHFIWKC